MFKLVLMLAGLMAAAGPLRAADGIWKLNPDCTVTVASAGEGRLVLETRDEFVRALSPFDRAARLQSGVPVSEAEFLAFAGGAVREWTSAEIQSIAPVMIRVSDRLSGWRLPLPAEIKLVQTTGREEGDAAYTRGNAIVLPATKLKQTPAQLERVLLHELFHVLSRHQPQLRDRLYGLVGFQPVGPVSLPPGWIERKITNPDAPVIEHRIEVEIAGRATSVMPVLFSREANYRAGDPRGFFAYLEFQLMEVEESGGSWVPVLRNGEPVLREPRSVGSFLRQIGRNTGYIIHPEEVLADNFVLLMLGDREVPDPGIVDRLGAALRAVETKK